MPKLPISITSALKLVEYRVKIPNKPLLEFQPASRLQLGWNACISYATVGHLVRERCITGYFIFFIGMYKHIFLIIVLVHFGMQSPLWLELPLWVHLYNAVKQG